MKDAIVLYTVQCTVLYSMYVHKYKQKGKSYDRLCFYAEIRLILGQCIEGQIYFRQNVHCAMRMPQLESFSRLNL